jgi:hypothetical protein
MRRLGEFLTELIADAEDAAGVSLFEPVEVRRVRTTAGDFGFLDVSFSFKAGSGPAKPRIDTITQSGFEQIGLDDGLNADFALGASPSATADLQKYFARVLANAQIDAGVDLGKPLLGETTVGYDASGMLAIQMYVSDNDGGTDAKTKKKATIELVDQSGLDPLGFDNVTEQLGGDTTLNDADRLRDVKELLDDLWTATLDTVASDQAGRQAAADYIKGYGAVAFLYIDEAPSGLPAHLTWSAAEPIDVDRLVRHSKSTVAVYASDSELSLGRSKILMQIDTKNSDEIERDKRVFAHELGHSVGYPNRLLDLYSRTQYRTDLLYMTDYCLMASSNNYPHFCGYSKLEMNWLNADRSDDARQVETLERPLSGTVTYEALLVPLEYQAHLGVVLDVWNAFGGETAIPVRNLIKIILGGDGNQFALIEARQEGSRFSTGITTPRIVISNGIDFDDDTRYANEEYRRKVHLLDDSIDGVTTTSFDLGDAPKLAAGGIEVEVLDVRPVVITGKTVSVFRVRLMIGPTTFVDLGFTDSTPKWRSPDIGIDAPPTGTEWPVGRPLDQGEEVLLPPEGGQPNDHRVMVRCWNFSPIPVENVSVDLIWRYPPGSGDDYKEKIANRTIAALPAADENGPKHEAIFFDWPVKSDSPRHVCFRAIITDWTVAPDHTAAVEPISDDLVSSNNWAQQNVFDFNEEAAGTSPIPPIIFSFSVFNDGFDDEVAYLQPEGLPPDTVLYVMPERQRIAPGETAIFRCRLEIDEIYLKKDCGRDFEFLLHAWRDMDHAEERWGGCKYRVFPRTATDTTLTGLWAQNLLTLDGAVSPDVAPGDVRLRLDFDDEPPIWTTVALKPGGGFSLQLNTLGKGADNTLIAEARYEGSNDHAPSRSKPLFLQNAFVG